MPNDTDVAIEEKILKPISGLLCMFAITFGMLAAVLFTVVAFVVNMGGFSALLASVSLIYICIVGPLLYCGVLVVQPNQAAVLTFFGKYYGTVKSAGFFYVNPFARPMRVPNLPAAPAEVQSGSVSIYNSFGPKRLSLKAMTLNNALQKINDKMGNPMIIGIVVIWRVADTARAMFQVENFADFLSIQCDSSLRGIVRLYPYDSAVDDEKTLRGSSDEIAEKMRLEIQEKVRMAGLEILEARITHLAYASEIASAMLQRQQAAAIVDARRLIVDGAVGIVQLALKKLEEEEGMKFSEDRKAAMISNLMVVLCGNKETTPTVNAGM
ncbi:MAG: SPFH domain-containing protein [Clostridiales bacterium]|nr:SPFH domain-containing protein [Clostridiales bacterium]